MEYTFSIKNVFDLTPQEIKSCKSLTMRANGEMTGNLVGILSGRRDFKLGFTQAFAVLAKDIDGKLLGWALVRHSPLLMTDRELSYYLRRELPDNVYRASQEEKVAFLENFADFNVYVRQSARRQGLGKALYNQATSIKDWSHLKVYPWDNRSRAFFNTKLKLNAPDY